MSHGHSKRHRHRGRQRRWRPLRWATFLIGAIAIPTGCLLLTWALRDRNETARWFGLLYISVGVLSLLICALLTTYTRLRGRDRAEPGPLPQASSRSGLALLMALLLMAFLSGVVVHTLISTHAKLRAVEVRRTRLLLRAAALDAAWDSLQVLTGTAARTLAHQTIENRLPSGIATRVTLHPMERTALPVPLQRSTPPMFGQYFSIAAAASREAAVGLARGLACRLPSGDIRVLCWWERP